VERRLVIPLVRRASEGVIHGLLVPFDACERILVFVFHADDVTELVQRGASAVRRRQVPPIDRGRLVQRNGQHVAADPRCRTAIRGRITDADFGFAQLADFLELEADADRLPLGERVADRVRHWQAIARQQSGTRSASVRT
jgi:hypothetical protein